MAAQDSTAPKRRAAPRRCEERRITVHRTFYERRPTPAAPYRPSRPVPWVQLKGYWLEQAGFTISTPIRVRVMDGCLVLTTLAPEEEAGDTR